MAKVKRQWLSEVHDASADVRVPLATFSPTSGPSKASVSIIAGMHPGEAAGLLAAQDLMTTLIDADLAGTVNVIPIASIEAFYARALQLSPIDERECHYMSPGHPDGTYTEHLVDILFRTVKGSDVVVDLHGGELVQDLTPYVGVPWRGMQDPLWDTCLKVASCFDVPFLAKRDVYEAGVALPAALLEAGVPNVWSEIGRNGLPEPFAIKLQYEGLLRVLGSFGVLDGVKALARHPTVLGPQHWVVFAGRSGVWRPEVVAGEHVVRSQRLGTISDEFGSQLQTYEAPGTGVVEYLCTSPAISHRRTPYGNRWHQLLAQIVSDGS
jgi:predicted deacylase